MKNLDYLLLTLFLLTSCTQRNAALSPNLLGKWEGYYKNEKITLSFTEDSSLSVLYASDTTSTKNKFKLIADKLIIFNSSPDTCFIKQTCNDSLILVPINQLEEDILLMYLVKYKRIS